MSGVMALRRGLLLAATLVMVGGCDGGVAPAVDTSRCAVPDYPAALSRTIDEIQIWAGNRSGFAPAPLVVSRDSTKIAAIAQFVVKRSDLWFVAAGETYDPATRRSGSEFTIKFLSEGKERAYVGWGYAYLETAGCGHEVVRPLSAPDRPELFHLVFDSPLRR